MRINKNTQLCISLAQKPSNFGTRFHNYLYEALNLNYVYKAFSPKNLQQAIEGVRGLPIRGCAISMPYKEEVIALVDELDASAQAIQSINTIVNTDGVLKAYNTDYIAITKLIEQYQISTTTCFALKGSGGMAKAVAFALKNKGFTQGFIVAKNEKTGKELAKTSGYTWQPELLQNVELIINATPIGMMGTSCEHELPFSEDIINNAQIIFDVVASPENTPMIKYAQNLDKKVIKGSEVFALQAREQFYLYTDIYPEQAVFEKAALFSRA